MTDLPLDVVPKPEVTIGAGKAESLFEHPGDQQRPCKHKNHTGKSTHRIFEKRPPPSHPCPGRQHRFAGPGSGPYGKQLIPQRPSSRCQVHRNAPVDRNGPSTTIYVTTHGRSGWSLREVFGVADRIGSPPAVRR